MSNNTGYYNKNGKLYYNGVEVIGGGGSEVHNTFNKICVYGTSIETVGGAWSSYMAEALGLTYGYMDSTKQVVNFGSGGGGICWYGDDTDINNVTTAYKNFVLGGFSCTQAEKQASADYFVSQGYMTEDEVTAAKNDTRWNLGFEQSVLAQENVDLYIFGTYGINDRHGWMKWTDENGLEQTTYVAYDTFIADPLQADLVFDRRTIYGAYNYVLRRLYQQNPNAKVVILGQHTRQWTNQDVVNAIQRAVADKWQIPFADWGNHFAMNDLWKEATTVHINWSNNPGTRQLTIYNEDGAHPTKYGAQMMGAWVADWITKTELKPLNPRWTL